MVKINLLPWREENRQQRKQEFVAAIGTGVVLTGFLFSLVYFYIEGMKEYQQNRNDLLNQEITLVNRKIKEIKDIESKKNKLLTKIEVIQQLQESRPQIVHLFDELAKSTPEGIFLTQFKQSGKLLTFTGKAQSNARVSAYMRAIEKSPWMQLPTLQVIQGKGKSKVSNGQLNDFSMVAKQGVSKPKNDAKKKGRK